MILTPLQPAHQSYWHVGNAASAALPLSHIIVTTATLTASASVWFACAPRHRQRKGVTRD